MPGNVGVTPRESPTRGANARMTPIIAAITGSMLAKPRRLEAVGHPEEDDEAEDREAFRSVL